jgi:hypothetical protein
MDLEWYIKTVLVEIKNGIDQFNREHKRQVWAEYPASFEIEHDGVKLSVPFSPSIAVSDIEGEHP